MTGGLGGSHLFLYSPLLSIGSMFVSFLRLWNDLEERERETQTLAITLIQRERERERERERDANFTRPQY